MESLLSLRASDEIWLARPVPRYTSYPPAPAFHDGVESGVYRSMLQVLGEEDAVSLYIHIPFCRSLCLYCGCHTTATQRCDRVEAYLEAVKSEVALVQAVLGRKQRVSHLHFGGGSPNIMSPEMMRGLFKVLNQSFDFSSCSEIAMELDPRLVTIAQIDAMVACGVTRVSLGVQDFNPKVQEAVNRIQPFDRIAEVCKDLWACGIKHINFDLMYGLPLQTPETIAETARMTLLLKPSRVSFFSYAHVPQIKPHQKALEVWGLPDKFHLLDQEQVGRAVLRDEGKYREIGMDHFALAGDALETALLGQKLHRNFQGYTDDKSKNLIGFGASSIGQTDMGFFQNEKDVETYQSAVALGELPIVRGILSSGEDRLRAEVIEELMCYLQCDLEAVGKKHQVEASFFEPELEALAPMCEAGIIARDGYRLALTTPRRMAVRVLCHAFDKYIGGKNTVASRAA